MKTWQHIIFWLVVHTSLTLIFGRWFENYEESFYYVTLLLPVVMGTSYFFNYYLVPRYLFRRRFYLFGLYSVYMFIISLCLELLVSVLTMLMMMQFGISDHGPLVTDVFLLALVLYFIVLFKSFILLIKHYFIDQGAISRLEAEKEKQERGYLTVLSGRKSRRIAHDELLYVESLSDYVLFHLHDGSEVKSKLKISHVEKDLPGDFLRIHRSFIVNKQGITSYDREEVFLGAKALPISRSYHAAVMDHLRAQNGS